PPVFHSGGSDTWSQVLEVSGAATSAPLLQVASNASDAPSWKATFAAPDSQPGDLTVGTGYWNGSVARGTVSRTKILQSPGGDISGTLTQAGNTWGQYAASV